MAKDPNLSKGTKNAPPDESTRTGKAPKPNGVKQPNTTGQKTPAGAADGKGKFIRKDQGATQPFDDGTQDFEMQRNESDVDAAAAAYLTEAFGDEAEDADSPGHAREEAAADGATQAFTSETFDTEMPQPAHHDTPVEGMTQEIANETIDTELPKEPAKRPSAPARKPAVAAGAAPPGAPKGTPMASMLGGKYKLLKKIGQGGMGSVYKAHDEKLDRIVAIKVLAKELSGKEAYVKRFEREAQVMVKLDHPNVIRCYDFDQDKQKGVHYLAIEFVDGGSIEGWLKKLGRFSIGDALHIVLKTAAGLQHAHEKSMIHRDVKPDNLLLTKEGIVKVADLGLAKDTSEDTSLTKTGSGAGTPIYMAPEQARDVKHVDCRVDIYALGVMLYVFLTGQPPFAGNTLVELISAKEKGKFEPMRRHNADVPSKLDLIVDKMIAKDPKSRYASCQEVMDDLEPLGLANDQLSFIEASEGAASPTLMPGPKAAPTSGPGKISPRTSVGGAGKAPAAKTSVPTSGANTAGAQQQIEKDVWYWTMVTQTGKSITKKMTTDQLRTLIKSGHLDPTAQLSKTEKSGARAAATYPEFQAVFKTLKANTKANLKGAKYRDRYKEIEEEDARRRKWGWLKRMFKSFGGFVFGLLWIVIILALVGGAGYFVYQNYLK